MKNKQGSCIVIVKFDLANHSEHISLHILQRIDVILSCDTACQKTLPFQ